MEFIVVVHSVGYSETHAERVERELRAHWRKLTAIAIDNTLSRELRLQAFGDLLDSGY